MQRSAETVALPNGGHRFNLNLMLRGRDKTPVDLPWSEALQQGLAFIPLLSGIANAATFGILLTCSTAHLSLHFAFHTNNNGTPSGLGGIRILHFTPIIMAPLRG